MTNLLISFSMLLFICRLTEQKLEMTVSDSGTNFVKQWEGLYLSAYLCPAKVWTIGYGHTKGVTPGQRITAQQAHDMLKQDLKSHMSNADSQITVSLTQNQYDAIASFCFNLGSHIFTRNRNLLDLINNRQWKAASDKMLEFNRANGKVLTGLVNRRKAEAELFMRDVGETGSPAAPARHSAPARPASPASSSGSSGSSGSFTRQNGVFTLNRSINLRQAPSASGALIATMQSGQTVRYDAYWIESYGYVWLRQPRSDGYGYIASGESRNGKRTSTWGSFR